MTVLAGLLLVVPRALADPDFSVPPALKPQVDFWVNVFTTYGKRQILIHDTENLTRVYSVVDFSDLDSEGLSEMQIQLTMKMEEDAEKTRVRSLLWRLDGLDPSTEAMSEEEMRIATLFASDPSPTKFRDAAGEDRLRGQRGLRERFARGIQVAHAYFPTMERIFAAEGVPKEITRLPLVESCFNVHAYSKVGAAGVWQFMPGTGRRFLRIDDAVDERLDPITSTRAAARFMRENYNDLGTWPLAIKAYNHGPAGVARAIRETGTTDVTTIIENYHGPAFKFASRNFYPEFLAALHVESNYRRYFGDLPLDQPLATDSVQLDQRTSIQTAARCSGTEPYEIVALNPSLLRSVHDGRQAIPAGYELKLPAGTSTRFGTCAAAVPPPRQVARRGSTSRQTASRQAAERSAKWRGGGKVKADAVVHKVKRGQTLQQIASLYGCSVDRIRRGNKLKGDKIHVGQVLRIPTS
jgi:membrane-bound lytic murein transglycosylase D